jgi:CheY-like chemotaxis protein
LSVKLLGCVKDGINLSFSIHDSGVGISKDDQIGVFDKFTQVLDGKRHSINGTGLGLSIAKGIIDVMDGELLLDSSLGEGSTFSFQVCIPEANRKSVDLILSSGCVNTISFKGKHILIVEDNKVNQTVAKKLISKIGASFELAEDGKIAVDMLKKDPDAFDLILMDNQMPVMTGLEATDVIKNTLGIKTPIVLCTADITEETKLESERLSMDGYITKPFKIAKLSKVLKKAI